MPREIRFKAWHKTLRKIMPVYQICWFGKKIKPHIVTNQGWIGLNDNVVLLQYTGLNDKFGEEIYEGFILNNGDGNYTFSGIDDWGMLTVIKNTRADIKIVGNIYENPELLEEKNDRNI